MPGTVVIACADQSLAYELRSQLAEVGDVEVVGLAETTTELVEMVTTHEPNAVLVHDQIGPLSVHEVVRDLGVRRPATVSVVVASDPDPAVLAAAMDAGARGVLTYPLSFDAVQQRVQNALEWSRQMEAMLDATRAGGTSARGRATVVVATGSKGGVGTTALLTHLAWDLRRRTPDLKVAVVDADLEKGDLTSYLPAAYRTSIADLAKVAEDLSPRTVADAMFEHESGLHLLLPPEDVREVEFVTPTAVRQIVYLLRQQYDLVLVDAGSHVTPVQVALVEIADEVVQVVTPDLVSLRGLRRDLGWWESFGARKPDAVKVLVNRRSKGDEIQFDAVRQLSPAPVLQTTVPHLGRRLEAAVNTRSPGLVEDQGWWSALRALAGELRVDRALAQDDDAPAAARPPREARTARAPRRAARAGARERGSASIEMLGTLPVLLLVAVVLVQLATAGLTYVWTGHAASLAARAAAVDPWDGAGARALALEDIPSGVTDDMRVALSGQGNGPVAVPVPTNAPLLAPGLLPTPWTLTVERQVVTEP